VVSFSLTPKWHFGIVLPRKSKVLSTQQQDTGKEKSRLISPSTTFDNISRNKARFTKKEQGHCWPCSK
jgi:hypothetical protein